MGVDDVMNEDDAQMLWNMITQTFETNWDDIEEVEPDDWDLHMLSEIKADPECHEFISANDAMKELGLA